MSLVNRCECWVPVAQAFKGSVMALLRALGGEQLVTWDAQTAEREVAQS